MLVPLDKETGKKKKHLTDQEKEDIAFARKRAEEQAKAQRAK